MTSYICLLVVVVAAAVFIDVCYCWCCFRFNEVPIPPAISWLSFIGMVRTIARVFVGLIMMAMATTTSTPTRRIAIDDTPPGLARYYSSRSNHTCNYCCLCNNTN